MHKGFVLEQFHFWHFNCISSQVLFFAMELWWTSHEYSKTFAFLNICSLWKKRFRHLHLPIYSSLTYPLHICMCSRMRAQEIVCVCVSQFVSLGFMGHLDAMMKAIATRTDWEVYSTSGVMMSRELLWNPTATGNKRLLHPRLFFYFSDSSLHLLPLLSFIPFSLFSLSVFFLCREACVCSHHTQGTVAFWSVTTR